MSIKYLFIVASEMLFPLLQPGNEPPGGRIPITESIVLLVLGALGIGIKTFYKKSRN